MSSYALSPVAEGAVFLYDMNGRTSCSKAAEPHRTKRVTPSFRRTSSTYPAAEAAAAFPLNKRSACMFHALDVLHRTCSRSVGLTFSPGAYLSRQPWPSLCAAGPSPCARGFLCCLGWACSLKISCACSCHLLAPFVSGTSVILRSGRLSTRC